MVKISRLQSRRVQADGIMGLQLAFSLTLKGARSRKIDKLLSNGRFCSFYNRPYHRFSTLFS